MPEDPDTPSQCLCDLPEEARDKSNVVIGRDANGHHFCWDSKDINSRGESIFDFILKYKLRLCNRGSDPTCNTKKREEVIDLTLTNMRIEGNW